MFCLRSATEKESDMMILVRDVFQAKFGKGGELVALFQEARRQGLSMYGERILTDASGPFYTVVLETTTESLAGGRSELQKSLPDRNLEHGLLG